MVKPCKSWDFLLPKLNWCSPRRISEPSIILFITPSTLPTLSSTFTSAGAGGSRCLPQELGSSEFTPEKWWVGRRAFPVSGANLLLVSGRVYLISLHCFSKYRLNGNTTPLKSIILWCEEVAYQELFVLGIQSSHETRGSRKASCQAV